MQAIIDIDGQWHSANDALMRISGHRDNAKDIDFLQSGDLIQSD